MKILDTFREYKGFKSVLIRFGLLLFSLILISLLLRYTITLSHFYTKYLILPVQYYPYSGVQRDVIINSIILASIGFILYNYKQLLKVPFFSYKIKENLFFLFLSLFFLVSHYLLKYIIKILFPKISMISIIFYLTFKVIFIILYVVSLAYFFLGKTLINFIFKNYFKSIITFLIIGILFFFIISIFQNLWYYFANIIAYILYFIFSLFFENIDFKIINISDSIINQSGGPLLKINSFSAVIGKSCSGIDSLFLFLILFFIIIILDIKKINYKNTIILFVIGAIGIFITNVLRIFLLFLVGIFISKEFAIGLFHSNVGWLLFIGYFFIYWSFSSKYIYKKQ